MNYQRYTIAAEFEVALLAYEDVTAAIQRVQASDGSESEILRLETMLNNLTVTIGNARAELQAQIAEDEGVNVAKLAVARFEMQVIGRLR